MFLRMVCAVIFKGEMWGRGWRECVLWEPEKYFLTTAGMTAPSPGSNGTAGRKEGTLWRRGYLVGMADADADEVEEGGCCILPPPCLCASSSVRLSLSLLLNYFLHPASFSFSCYLETERHVLRIRSHHKTVGLKTGERKKKIKQTGDLKTTCKIRSVLLLQHGVCFTWIHQNN